MNPTLTRAEVARILGVHVSSVRRLERSGELRGTKDRDRITRYDRRHVLALAEKRGRALPYVLASGPITKMAFELFEEGRTLVEVVKAVAIPASTARALWLEWKTPLGAAPPRHPNPLDELRAEVSHAEEMRALERENERRRRQWDEEPPSSRGRWDRKDRP